MNIDFKHKEKLEMLNEEEKINYLLNIAEIFEDYDKEYECEESDKNINKYVSTTKIVKNGDLLNRYLNITENTPLTIIEHKEKLICECGSEKKIIHSDAQIVCLGCGISEFYFDCTTQGLTYEQEVNSESTTSFAYKRINHFNEWLIQFQAKGHTSIPEDILEQIKGELKKERLLDREITQKKIKEILKKLKYNKYYENVGIITNIINKKSMSTMEPELEEKLRNMFRMIQEPFDKHKPKNRSNFLSYSYCLYKFCELLDKDEYLCHFPLLKSREKLQNQDSIWKNICLDLGWEFMPTA